MQLFKDNNGRLKTKAIFWAAVCGQMSGQIGGQIGD